MIRRSDVQTEMGLPTLDDTTTDRLVAGAVAPQDAPPGYAEVARLMQAAGAEPSSCELIRERQTVAEMAASVTEHPPARPQTGSRGSPRTAFRLKMATLVVVGMMAAGAGLAFAGSLPGPAQSFASHVLRHFGLSVPGPDVHSGAGDSAPIGPDPAGPATFGLCTAFGSGQGAANGSESDSVAFQELRTAARHAGQTVEQFCAGAAPIGRRSPVAPPITPNLGGTGTANVASGGASERGTRMADTMSGGHSSTGSGNRHGPLASRRPSGMKGHAGGQERASP